MSILVRAGKNIFYKAIAEILSRFIYFFLFIYMARKLGAGDFGIFSFAFSLAGIFMILVDPGLNTLLTRDVSKDRTLVRLYGDTIFTVKTLLSIASFSLLLVFVKLLGYDNRTIRVVLIMGIYLILNSLLDFLVSLSNAYERMDIEASIRITNKIFVSAIGAVVLFLGSSLDALLAWMVVGSIAAVLLSFHIVKKVIVRVRLSFDWQLSKSILVKASPIALTMIFYVIYFKIDVVMLSLFHVSNTDIGYYSASVKLIEILNVIPGIIVMGIFPILSDLHEKSPSDLLNMIRKTYKILLLIAIPITIVTSFLSGVIINAIYGIGYDKSASALVIIIWTSLFIFPNILLTNVYIVANMQRLNALFAFICLLLNIAMNLYLIPRYGFIGSSIATVVTDGVFFMLSAFFASRVILKIGLLRNSAKPLVCGLLLVGVMIIIEGLATVYLLPIAGVSYLLFIYLTRALTREDVLQIKKAFI